MNIKGRSTIRKVEVVNNRYKPRKKYANILWFFNPQDNDFWPSIPHGHSGDAKYPFKLDIFSGKVFDKMNTIVATVRMKELVELHNDPGFIEVDKKADQYYRENFPEVYNRLGYPKDKYLGRKTKQKLIYRKQIRNMMKSTGVFKMIIPVEIE